MRVAKDEKLQAIERLDASLDEDDDESGVAEAVALPPAQDQPQA